MRSAAIASTSSALERAGRENARLRGAAGEFGDGEKGRARQRIFDRQARGAAVGHQEFAVRAARFGDAIGIGERDQRAVGEIALPPSSREGAPSALSRSGRVARPPSPAAPNCPRGASRRVRASSHRTASAPADARDRRRCRRARARRAAWQDRRRAPPRRDAPPRAPCAARRGASGSARIARPVSVSRPSSSSAPSSRSSATASFQAGAGGGSSQASCPGSLDAPGREIEHEARRDRRREFPARRRPGARRSAARPTGDSRRRARCGPRGRGADRRWRARRARSRAATGRDRARNSCTRERPQSMTTRTPSIVSEVSAIEVASDDLAPSRRAPARWRRSCSPRSIAP